jgi:hypothetical protein
MTVIMRLYRVCGLAA